MEPSNEERKREKKKYLNVPQDRGREMRGVWESTVKIPPMSVHFAECEPMAFHITYVRLMQAEWKHKKSYDAKRS